MKINGVQVNEEVKGGIEVVSFDETHKFTFITIGEIVKLYDAGLLDLECIIDNIKVQRELLPTGKNSTRKIDDSDFMFSIITDIIISAPHIAFYKSQWKVTDGQQRLTIIINFVKNMFAIKLNEDNLIELESKKYNFTAKDLDNNRFNQLPEILRTKILNTKITMQVLELNSREEFYKQFIKTNSGISVNSTEKLKAMLGDYAPDFKLLLQKNYIKNVLKTMSDSRENKLDVVLKLAYLIYKSRYNDDKKTRAKTSEQAQYAINDAKLRAFIKKIKSDTFLRTEIMDEAKRILDYMELAFDKPEYYNTDKIQRINSKGNSVDTKYNFLGKSKSHSIGLFICAIMCHEKLDPNILYDFAFKMHVSIGKSILDSKKRGEDDYNYLYWFNTSDSPTNGKMYLYLKKAFEVYLKSNNYWNELNKDTIAISA